MMFLELTSFHLQSLNLQPQALSFHKLLRVTTLFRQCLFMNEKFPGGSRRLEGRPLLLSLDGFVTSELEMWFSEKRILSGEANRERISIRPSAGTLIKEEHDHTRDL